MTVDLIVQLQKGDSSATLTLVEKFNPLLKKYAYKLNYEDSYNDLLLDFIVLLNKMRLDRMQSTNEGILVSYICASIRSSYIKKLIALKKLQNFVPYSALSDGQLFYIEAATATSDTYFELEFTGFDYVLTELELSIVKMIYLSGYSVTEIASFYGISRQAVNKTKKRALQKLEKWIRTSLEWRN